MSLSLEPEVPAIGPVDTPGLFILTLAGGPPKSGYKCMVYRSRADSSDEGKENNESDDEVNPPPPVRGQPRRQEAVMEIHHKMVMMMKMMMRRTMISLTLNRGRLIAICLKIPTMRRQASSTSHRPLRQGYGEDVPPFL